MVKRGHEVDLIFQKEIMDRMNNFFGKTVVEKIKFTSFEDDQKISKDLKPLKTNVTKNEYQKKSLMLKMKK